MECKLAVSLMHDYLDDDLSKEQQIELKAHLLTCLDCRMQFKELERTDMLMFSLTHHASAAPFELTHRIMSAIPQQKKQQLWVKWVKRHPAITAAAIFLMVMLFSTVSFWDQDGQLVVKGNDLEQVIIEGDTVIVPAGRSISGNLTVENGKTQIYGDVKGNLTVIDGSLYQASTAHISGQVKSIDQAVDWIWYKISNIFSDVAYR
ncbi:zf-HC2 domain-containing protein [Paenibacillus pini]|uniref:Anti-sigma-W factor RsiW n=1 Tax=Paenibacillus pini JCM 16418 TaxID=1236976 RepID=W7YHE6_9BACL|nr:zf-HC2 domain-containing protein [Paenibacillus pini]GAF10340.1 anti-sigma-W factor RsiW [Paenibacillus pini JCM 16418]